jgi:hypothetical protein
MRTELSARTQGQRAAGRYGSVNANTTYAIRRLIYLCCIVATCTTAASIFYVFGV